MANFIHWYYKALYSPNDAETMYNMFMSMDVDVGGFYGGKPFCDAKPLEQIDNDIVLLQADGWCECSSMMELTNPKIAHQYSLGPTIGLYDDFIYPKDKGIIVWQTENYEDTTYAAFISPMDVPLKNAEFVKDKNGNVFKFDLYPRCVYINGTPINKLSAKERELVSKGKDGVVFNIAGKTITESILCAEEFSYVLDAVGLYICYSNPPLKPLNGKTGTLHFELNGLNYHIFAGMNSKKLKSLLESQRCKSLEDFTEFLVNPGEDARSIIFGARSMHGNLCKVISGKDELEIPINAFKNTENVDIPAMIFSKDHDVVVDIDCGGTTIEDDFFCGTQVNSVLELELPEGETFDCEKFKWKTVSILNYDGSLLARMVLGASYNGKNLRTIRTDAYTEGGEDCTCATIYVPENVVLPNDCENFADVIPYNLADKKQTKNTYSQDFYDLSKEEKIVDLQQKEFTNEDGELMSPAEIAKKSEYFSDKLFESLLRNEEEDSDDDEDSEEEYDEEDSDEYRYKDFNTVECCFSELANLIKEAKQNTVFFVRGSGANAKKLVALKDALQNCPIELRIGLILSNVEKMERIPSSLFAQFKRLEILKMPICKMPTWYVTTVVDEDALTQEVLPNESALQALNRQINRKYAEMPKEYKMFPARIKGVSKKYMSIQAAIDAAKDGDTVLLAPGFHKERFVVNKKITLEGTSQDFEQSTIWYKDGFCPIRVCADATLRNFRVVPMRQIDSINIIDIKHWERDNCITAIIENVECLFCAGNAIHVEKGNTAVIEGCDIHDGGGTGLYIAGRVIARNSKFRGNQGNGILVKEGGCVDVENCEIHGNGECGLEVYGKCRKARLTDSKLYENRIGIHVSENGSVSVKGCDIHSNQFDGISVVHSESKAQIESSEIHNNGWNGVCVLGENAQADVNQNCQIYDNKMEDMVHVSEKAQKQ